MYYTSVSLEKQVSYHQNIGSFKFAEVLNGPDAASHVEFFLFAAGFQGGRFLDNAAANRSSKSARGHGARKTNKQTTQPTMF